VEAVKGRGFGDDFLKALQGAVRALPPDQQVDSPDFGKIA